MNKVICIVGPTGIGKTKLALALANKLNTKIINGDAIQMFQEVDILSAKPTIQEQQSIHHYLLDFLALDQNYDVALFKKDATKIINQLNDENKIPIIVGGSGLYIKSLIYDYEFQEVSQRSEETSLKYQNYTNEELFNYLKEIDYQTSEKLHANNRKRVLRAIEIFEDSKQAKSELLAKQKHEVVFDALIIGLEVEREQLYNRINYRVDEMVKQGLIEEVSSLYQKYPNQEFQAFQAIGYKEFIPYFENEISLDDALDKIKQNSRRYAKKQITWFKNQMKIDWLTSDFDDFDQTIKQASILVEEFLDE